MSLRVLRPLSAISANSITVAEMQGTVNRALIATLLIDPARIAWLAELNGSSLFACLSNRILSFRGNRLNCLLFLPDI